MVNETGMALTRRQLLRAGMASGAVLLARPTLSRANMLGPAATAAGRQSKLGGGLRLVHADLHNHSLLSDGDGDAANAFASMQFHGLDVAALTDHSGVGKLQGDTCDGCAQSVGIDEQEWQRIGALADASNADGSFVAVRGFEWSSPTLGHMNVWFSSTWTDPLATGAIGANTTAGFLLHEGSGEIDQSTATEVNRILRAIPEGCVTMRGFYDWLAADPTSPVVGGGLDAIAGFNHPGREGGRFGYFAYDEAIAPRVVSIEMFNRGEDYLFEGFPTTVSPLVECLDAGWRVGIIGVTDEHGTNWGEPEGKGRTGVWIGETALTRAGVRAGMESRRFFATREQGLRVDATANGVPMGGTLTHDAGDMTFALDIDKGTDWTHHALRVQVLQTGNPLPSVVFEHDIVVPAADEPAITFTAPISRANGEWVVLRVTDPAGPADGRAPDGPYRAAGRGVAYASPFFLSAPTAPPSALPIRTHTHSH
jgi:hypothetical protein